MPVLTFVDTSVVIKWALYGFEGNVLSFVKKHSQKPSYFLLNRYLNSAILNFHIISFANMQSAKTAKIFCFETFTVYGMYLAI